MDKGQLSCRLCNSAKYEHYRVCCTDTAHSTLFSKLKEKAATQCDGFVKREALTLNKIGSNHALRFMLAGNSLFCLTSGKTGISIVYRLKMLSNSNGYFKYKIYASFSISRLECIGCLIFNDTLDKFTYSIDMVDSTQDIDTLVNAILYTVNELYKCNKVNVTVYSFNTCGYCGKANLGIIGATTGIDPRCANKVKLPGRLNHC